GDAFGDVAHEHVAHELRAAKLCARPLKVEVHRYVVVGVDARGDDDVEVGGAGDAFNARDVAAQADDREINDGINAARLQLVEPRDGISDATFFITPAFGVILHDLCRKHKNVFVHQRDAETVGVYGATHGVDLRHIASQVLQSIRCSLRCDGQGSAMSLIAGDAPGKLAKRDLLRKWRKALAGAAKWLTSFLFHQEKLIADADAPLARHAGRVRRDGVVHDSIANPRTA